MIPVAETLSKALKIVRVMIKLQEQEVLPLRGVGRNLNLHAFINLVSEVKLLFLGCCFFLCCKNYKNFTNQLLAECSKVVYNRYNNLLFTIHYHRSNM